jgi:hypothetical protein
VGFRELVTALTKGNAPDIGVTGTDLGTKRGMDTVMYPGSGLGDAFGRLRVSNLTTVFSSKQLDDNQPLFWDDQETSGGGTSSTYNANQASSTLAVSATTAGTRVRQSFQKFNYQPGKSQLILMTGVLGAPASGITERIGYFDESNGLFFECKDSTVGVVTRTKTSGTAVDAKVNQSAWNLDTMDGNGPSKITLDFTKTQIFIIDFEWLGVGRVRMGFFNGGNPVYCHEFLNDNSLDKVYMSTPNLPLRYEIGNDGTGPAASLVHICASVSSEGGVDRNGILRHVDSAPISGLATTVNYAVLGLRHKSTHLDISILLETLSLIATSQNDQAHWSFILNPTVAGTFTYGDVTNSAAQIAQGAVTNTITGGTEIDGGYFNTAQPSTIAILNALRLGAKIDGTPDEIVVLVRPITNNITVETSITWRELS